ncbi:MAG: STM4015 family protein [Gemmataceae bacterium]
MTLSEHADVFFNRPVKLFNDPADWEGPDKAYRVATTWEDEAGAMGKRLDQLIAQPRADELAAIVIGAWTGDDSSVSSESIVGWLAGQKDRLPGLRAIFFGDITYEENEISWIEQSDMAPLLAAYPRLEVLRVRGGNSLRFSKLRHDALQELIVETGGLRRSTVREICRCEFPNLSHLELWLGVENYGWDGGVEDLQPILAGKAFPHLKYLGLRNSDIVDDIAPVIVNAPILRQLEVLDLSNGTMTDAGGRALLNLPTDLPLHELNLSHHYMTNDMVVQLLKTLPFPVIVDDGQDPDDEWRSVVVSE